MSKQVSKYKGRIIVDAKGVGMSDKDATELVAQLNDKTPYSKPQWQITLKDMYDNHGHYNTEKCKVDECSICAMIDCPHGEPMHYHHDGCPACYEMESPFKMETRTYPVCKNCGHEIVLGGDESNSWAHARGKARWSKRCLIYEDAWIAEPFFGGVELLRQCRCEKAEPIKVSENRGPVDGIGGAKKRISPASPALKVGEDGTQDASCAKSESQPPRSKTRKGKAETPEAKT